MEGCIKSCSTYRQKVSAINCTVDYNRVCLTGFHYNGNPKTSEFDRTDVIICLNNSFVGFRGGCVCVYVKCGNDSECRDNPRELARTRKKNQVKPSFYGNFD